jgi:opacity protein-like surface antigen
MRSVHSSSLRLILYCLVPTGLLATATPVSAEWFADLYGGGAYTVRSDLTLVIGSPSGPADHVFHEVKWNRSAVLGARAGYWFAPRFGIGLDIFHFNANIPAQTVQTTIQGATAPATLQAMEFSTTAFAFDVLRFRYPLEVNAEFPGGRLQPYAALGPALFRTRVRNTGNSELTTARVTDTALGYKAGAGLSWQLTKRAALFGEYRYTHFRAEPVLRGTITSARVPMRSDIDTHHLLGGVSFSF